MVYLYGIRATIIMLLLCQLAVVIDGKWGGIGIAIATHWFVKYHMKASAEMESYK